MDWTVYWFQSIACFVFASLAMFSGITGAALMLPSFVIGFALLDVPEITIQQAIAAALFLETAAFTVGIYRYSRRGLIDMGTVRVLAPLAAPVAVVGALLAHWAPEMVLRLSQRYITGAGAFMTGLNSTGVGEATSPSLIIRNGYPVPIAAATSIVLVAVTDISAVLTHFTQFIVGEGLGAIPWNLIVWGIPGMALGALLGSHFQGRVNQRLSELFFAGLFLVISITFLFYTVVGT
jgi:uncharacterized membrane protein YfcA